ncbi:MAG TPA: alkaline phosphatase [Bryobacteraceae bacterium]|nr:alkaline phosphatase [Bryobacteraceae bacterium]
MSFFRITFLFTLVLTLSAAPKPGKRAKNVILFLADAAGIPTLNAASLRGYGEPQKLYIQNWPNVALSDTSTASSWVTDSAAGMTAIVTGSKTHNGVISQGPDTIRGKKDGSPLKTILEYAEQHGLSTGVLTNVNVADATPAACYSQANDRRKFGDIFLQIFKPRYGDGVDVVMGIGRKPIYDGVQALGKNLAEVAEGHKRPIYSSLADVPSDNPRPIVLLDRDMNVPAAALLALRVLSKNRKGYFLMIEWDAHTDDPQRGLDNVVNFDKLIREIASKVDLNETLLLFTADHSFELRAVGGKRGEPILSGLEEWKRTHGPRETIEIPALRVGHNHTGEEVLAAAQGPGAHQVRGFLPNTRIFQVMMDAYGWKQDTK